MRGRYESAGCGRLQAEAATGSGSQRSGPPRPALCWCSSAPKGHRRFIVSATSSAAATTAATGPAAPVTGTARVKRGMADMLKGGVIMDVVTPEQAKIAEDAGAVAVMALE